MFGDTGCQANFIRENEDEHMNQNTQKHLALMPAATLRISQDFEQKLQEQQEMFEKKMKQQKEEHDERMQQLGKQLQQKDEQVEQNRESQKELQEQMKEKNQQIKQVEQKMKEKDKQIESLQSKIQEITPHVHSPPYYCTLSNYRQVKANVGYIFSPPMYTHPGGYKYKLSLWPNGIGPGTGTHVSVLIYSVKSDHDAELKVPVKFTITVQLPNQHRDQDHHTRDIPCEMTREKIGGEDIGYDWTFIPHADLEWNRAKQTQYLKDDCLRFRITKTVVH